MKITRIGNPEIVMQNPDSIHNYFGWPTAARLQNGRIAVVASGFRMDHLCPFGKMVIAFSDDNGKTYTAPAPIIDTPLDDRDGGILPFGESGVIVTSFNHRRAPYREWAKGWAEKKGATAYVNEYLNLISDEQENKFYGTTFRISNDCGVTFGPIHKSPVSSPHGPCALSDGTVLWVGAEHPRKKSDFIKAYKISPNGSCELVGAIEDIYVDGELQLACEPYTVELDDGRLLCHIRVQNLNKSSVDGTLFTVFQSISEDKGKTWSKPTQILPDKSGAPAHVIKHSSGTLISVYGRRIQPYGIKAMFSSDNGKTWDVDYDVYPSGVTTDLGYPTTVELPDGSLLTVFYARPVDSPAVVIMQQRWRFEA